MATVPAPNEAPRSAATLDTSSGERANAAPDPGTKHDDLTGQRLLHFHVVGRLGAGGMGVVYRAIDEKLRRPVALKVLAARYLIDDRNRVLLFREARSAAALQHPNIATILDVHDAAEAAFLTMELVDGEPLRARIERGPLPVDEAVRLSRQIAEGLAHAHSAGVVHRDLKPENVMITKSGRVKLLDFGLAKLADEGEPLVAGADLPPEAAALAPTMAASGRSTEHGRIMGTPAYMAPEQARGSSIDARTDVFAFGVLLYEMLAGKPPFAHRMGMPWAWREGESGDWTPTPRLSELAPHLNRELEELVRSCLAFRPEARPDDGAALCAALDLAPSRRDGRRIREGALVLFGAAIVGFAVWGQSVFFLRKPPAARSVAARAAARAGTFRERRLVGRRPDGSPVMAANLSLDRSRFVYLDAKGLWVQATGGGDSRLVRPWRERPVNEPNVHFRGASDQVVVRGFHADPGVLSIVSLESGAIVEELHVAQMSTRSTWMLSPDGAQIAFEIDDGVFVQSLDGKGRRRVAEPRKATVVTTISWSPDQSRVAYVSSVGGGTAYLDIASTDGSGSKTVLTDRRLVNSTDGGVAFLSESRLVYTLGVDIPEPGAELLEQDLDMPNEKPRTIGRYAGVRAHDVEAANGALFFLRTDALGSDVFVGSLSADARRLETPLAPVTGTVREDEPRGWLDDDRLVFGTQQGASWDIFSLGTDGTDRKTRLVARGLPRMQPSVSTKDGILVVAPGPDASAPCTLRVATDGGETRPFSAGGTEPVVSKCDARYRCAAGQRVCVTSETAGGETTWWSWDVHSARRSDVIHRHPRAILDWDLSPDGSTVAFGANDDRLRRIDVAAKKVTETLLSPGGILQFLSFLPDGRQMIATGIGFPTGTYALLRIDGNGHTEPLATSDSEWMGWAAVSRDGRRVAIDRKSFVTEVWMLEPE